MNSTFSPYFSLPSIFILRSNLCSISYLHFFASLNFVCFQVRFHLYLFIHIYFLYSKIVVMKIKIKMLAYISVFLAYHAYSILYVNLNQVCNRYSQIFRFCIANLYTKVYGNMCQVWLTEHMTWFFSYLVHQCVALLFHKQHFQRNWDTNTWGE